MVLCLVAMMQAATINAQTGDILAAETATLTVLAESDSEGTTGMHYAVVRYADQTCAKADKPRKLFRKKFASKKQNLGQTSIPASGKFWLQINYQESRRGQERFCDNLLGFDPKAGHDYRVSITVSGQVSMCKIEVFEGRSGQGLSLEPIEHEHPEYSCKKVNKQGNPNSAPVHSSLKRF